MSQNEERSRPLVVFTPPPSRKIHGEITDPHIFNRTEADVLLVTTASATTFSGSREKAGCGCSERCRRRYAAMLAVKVYLKTESSSDKVCRLLVPIGGYDPLPQLFPVYFSI